MPPLAMGCGVFLQSDIVNQQRKGWSGRGDSGGALRPSSPSTSGSTLAAEQLGAVGRKFILQGGTHKNLAVVKTQVDFITSKVPDAEVVVHPHSGEAGAIGAALARSDRWERGGRAGSEGST